MNYKNQKILYLVVLVNYYFKFILPLLVTGFLLFFFWILAIYSVSIHESFSLTLKLVDLWQLTEPSNYFYFWRQLRNFLYWLILAFIVYKIPLKFFKNSNVIIGVFILCIILQLLVFTPLWIQLNGAKWWLYISGYGTLQPSEFFKLWFVMFLAWWFLRKKQMVNSIEFFIAFIVLLAIIFWVFLFIPDLWTILVLGLVSLIMCWYAWARLKYILLISFSWIFLWTLVGMQFSYIQKRIEHFFYSDIDSNNRGIWWQTQQWLIAIGWGWFLGKGYGKWLQKFGYIPEAQSDFVFAAYSEEIGFFGNSILLWLYFFLCFIFLIQLHKVKDDYLRLMWVWIISLIIVQMFVNIWVNIKIIPPTGLTLPFISFGGTALIVNSIQLVLMYKIIYKNTS